MAETARRPKRQPEIAPRRKARTVAADQPNGAVKRDRPKARRGSRPAAISEIQVVVMLSARKAMAWMLESVSEKKWKKEKKNYKRANLTASE